MVQNNMVGLSNFVKTVKSAPTRGPLVKVGWLGLSKLGDSLQQHDFAAGFL